MLESDSFSKRMGYETQSPPITIWEDAPSDFRYAVLQVAKDDMSLSPDSLRDIACKILRKKPDANNWSPPNVWGEVESLFGHCEWFKFYDIVETIADNLERKHVRYKSEHVDAQELFDSLVSELMREFGIGWKLDDGVIQARGEESYEEHLALATKALEDAKKPTAITELKEAIGDISRRPTPDCSGAIQHSMAALECVARDVSGDAKPTLGAVIKKNPDLFPKPVDDAVGKLWGYASENARHGREGNEPTREEAMLTVGIAATLVNYLLHKSV